MKFTRCVNEIFANSGLPELKPCLGNGGSDAADMTAYGIPTLDNLGTEGGEGHSIREYTTKKSIKLLVISFSSVSVTPG
jgi:acetylornithine deacetylase/succinyl-diaminopimelate desuccinylase-like protein